MPKHTEVEMLLESLLRVEGEEKREALKQMWTDAIERGMNHPASFNP